ncbi:MAG TPA: hypothetical protein VL728_03855 [Cyclobacteriaceae bacterium]|nr:hypothetical protein [Cyclobacteriaceae bacterium]
MNIVRNIFNLLRFDRANWKAVVLCILASMVFWIFNAFNKEYSANLSFPILFEFDGERYVPSEHFPKAIAINVKGIGWDLIRRRVGLKQPEIIIRLDRPSEIKKIVAATLIPVLTPQVGNLKINFVATDTLFVDVDKRDVHRFSLKADISSISFRSGFGRISPVVILPDSVKLEGPQTRLHALVDSILLNVEAENVSENFRQEVEITFPGSEFVKRDPPLAQVMFEVGQVQVITQKLKVRINSLTRVKIQDSVAVSFQIPLNRTSDFESQLREIELTVNERQWRGRKSLQPRLLNVPSYATVIKIDPIQANTD